MGLISFSLSFFHIRDKYNADDFIGTCFINISDVSAPGDHGESVIVITGHKLH